MSFKLVRTGPASPVVTSLVGQPTAVRISGDGLRAFHRSQGTAILPNASGFEGQINAVDWNGTAWSIVSGIGGQTGGGEIWDEGKNEFQISKNAGNVAWDFQYKSPNTFQYTGIHVSGQNYQIIYAFVPSDPAAPSLATGTQVTPNANLVSNNVYVPKKIRFSDDATRRFVFFQSSNNLIEVNPGGSSGNSTILFPFNGAHGNNLQNFEVSGDGNHLFVFIGGSLKLFSWDSSAWQFANDFPTTGSACAVNFDGSLVAIQNAGVKVYKKTGNTWAQLGNDLPDGTPWVNSAGNLVRAGGKLFEWSGSDWIYKWDSIGALSDDGTVAVWAFGAGSISRYELKNVAPIYFGGTLASAVYAGSTEGKQVYYGAQKLWP